MLKKLSMSNLRLAALCVGLAISATSCAGPFDACVKPVINQITWQGTTKELGEVVAAFLLCEPTSEADVPMCAVAGLEALEQSLGPDGKKIINCIVAYYEHGGSSQLQVRAKAMAVRRGIHAENLSCGGVRVVLSDVPKGVQ